MKPFEIIHQIDRGYIRYALFDFDGTISLIREGWQGVMIPMMVEILAQCPEHENNEVLHSIVKEYVTRLTGKQTIYQMIHLCEEIQKRGGFSLDPLEYKNIYLDLLSARIENRIRGLQERNYPPEEFMVPGSREMLNFLQEKKIICILASGTDEKFVIQESRLLQIDSYFQEIYGAKDDYRNFSKKMIIDNIIGNFNLHGKEFVTFGDGFVEIEDTKSVGGIAVGVASNEATKKGIDLWKRKRLIDAGADIITPDFRNYKELASYLFLKPTI